MTLEWRLTPVEAEEVEARVLAGWAEPSHGVGGRPSYWRQGEGQLGEESARDNGTLIG